MKNELIFILVFAMSIELALATSTITPVLTPNGSVTTSNITIQYNMSYSNLLSPSNIIWDWNNINYSLYDSSLVLFYNFDNRSSLGENNTKVVDLSQHGNNGTVIGGSNITWTPNGKYGGSINHTLGGLGYISSTSNGISLTNGSISIWFYNNKALSSEDAGLFGVGTDGSGLGLEFNAYILKLNWWKSYGVTSVCEGSFTEINPNWHHLVVTWNGIINNIPTVKMYLDNSPLSVTGGNITTTQLGTLTIGTSFVNNYKWNGSIDEVMVWNRSLSATEISQLYKSQITKYDSQNWSFTSNQIITTANSTYYLCSADSTGNNACSSQQTVSKAITSGSLTANFTSSMGNIRSDFYGVNTHGVWSSNESYIDTDSDGISDTRSNYTWHRQKMLEAGIKYIRGDMALNYLVFGIPNPNVENWYLINASFPYHSGDYNIGYHIPLGWEVHTYDGSGNITRSNDAHSGLYSVNLTLTNGSALYSTFDLLDLPVGHIYNYIAWMKSAGGWHSGYITIQQLSDYAGVCTSFYGGSGNWEQLNCTVDLTSATYVPQGYRMIAQNNKYIGSILWDDVQFLQDGVPFNNTPTSSLLQQKDTQKWASENNITVQWIASYMPDYLANITSDCASDIKTCDSINNTLWGDAVVKFIDAVGNNGAYANNMEIEVWNEPDLTGFFLSDVTSTSQRAARYGKLYNATRTAIKAKYPSMAVGGPTVTGHDSDSETFLRNILQNYTADFISYHRYLGQGTGTNYDDVFQTDVTWILGICSEYNANCSRFVFDEFNIWNWSLKVTQDPIWAEQLALGYSYLLQDYAPNITTVMYQWSESNKYSDTIHYSEYPQRWSMVSEPLLDNATYASFNVTKSFATYCPAGAAVYTSTSNDSLIKTVSCKNGTAYNVIVINKDTNSINITLNVGSSNITNFTDSSGNVYSVTSGVAQLGVLNSYGIMYLGGVTLDTTPPNLTLTSPLDLANFSTLSITFLANASDDVGLQTFWLRTTWLNGTETHMITSALSGVLSETLNRTIIFLNDGVHMWNYTVQDTSGNYNYSVNRFFTIDTTPPSITNLLNYSITTNSAILNWTVNEAANWTLSYGTTVNLGINIYNSSFTVGNIEYDLSGLSSSTLYFYNITACDILGNCNVSGSYNFITVTPPSGGGSSTSPSPTNPYIVFYNGTYYTIFSFYHPLNETLLNWKNQNNITGDVNVTVSREGTQTKYRISNNNVITNYSESNQTNISSNEENSQIPEPTSDNGVSILAWIGGAIILFIFLNNRRD